MSAANANNNAMQGKAGGVFNSINSELAEEAKANNNAMRGKAGGLFNTINDELAEKAAQNANNIAMQGKSGGIFNSINSMPSVEPLQYSSGAPPGIVKNTSVKPSGPRWEKATDLLEGSAKAKADKKPLANSSPVFYNPLTGELETTVQLRGKAGTLYGSKTVPLKLTGYTGLQLASSYYFSEPVQSIFKSLNTSVKASEQRNMDIEKMKADIEKAIADDKLTLTQLSNPKDPKAPKLKEGDRKMIEARIAKDEKELAKLLEKQKEAAAAVKVEEDKFAAKLRYVPAGPAPAAAPAAPAPAPAGAAAAAPKKGMFGSMFSGWGTKKAARRRVNRSRRH